jgi:hypothetical protein
VPQRRALLLRNGLIAGCTLVAIVLLASFYSIVSGAVERAARHRLAVADGSAPPSLPVAARPAARRVALLGRSEN